MPNWLPDFTSTFQASLNTYLTEPLQAKSEEFKHLLETKTKEFQLTISQFHSDHKRFQQAVIAILLAAFLVLVIMLILKEK